MFPLYQRISLGIALLLPLDRETWEFDMQGGSVCQCDTYPEDCGVHANQPQESHPYRLCRDCHGWGRVTSTYPGGLWSTEDCARCAGSGEETR